MCNRMLLGFLIILTSGSNVLAQGGSEYQTKFLKGIDTLTVFATCDPVLNSRISEYRIKTLAELKLRRSGFVVQEKIDGVKAQIFISITALPIETHDEITSYAISYAIRVEQVVILGRDYSITGVASTWSYSGVAHGGIDRAKEYVESIVDEGMDAFLNGCMSVSN